MNEWAPVLVALVLIVSSLGFYAMRRALAANAIYQLSYEYRHRKSLVQVFFSKSRTTMRTSMTRAGAYSQVPMIERRRIMPELKISIDYTNWRGERRQRLIEPTGQIEFRSDQWHKTPQWMIQAYDTEDSRCKWWPLANIHGVTNP